MRDRVETQSRFKIQYPMKNRSKGGVFPFKRKAFPGFFYSTVPAIIFAGT
jgi:hypothetical protein